MTEPTWGDDTPARGTSIAVVAVDPPGCGCTECLVGTYVPLDCATPSQILDAQCGAIGDNTGGLLPTLPTYTRETRREVSCLPEDDMNAHLYTLAVEYRGRDLWAVTRLGHCLDTDGTWDWEPSPSNREDDWLDDHRFDKDTALRLAQAAAPRVTCNGRTVADVLRRHQEASP